MFSTEKKNALRFLSIADMSNISAEVFSIVYSHLNSRDLAQCIRVSKTWKELALPFIYKILHLGYLHVSLVKMLLRLSPVERDPQFYYGRFTKSLHVRSVLDLGSSPDATAYTQFTYMIDSNKSLLKIQNVVPGKNVRFALVDRTTDDFNFATCYKHRATMVSLKVEYRKISFNMGCINGDQLTLLTHFNKLTQLDLRNSCSPELTMFDIRDACPHLVTLQYWSKFDIPDLTTNEVLDEEKYRIVNHDIKTLSIAAPSMPKNFINHIAKYVTCDANALVLDIFGNNFVQLD
ncbi:uncharacterized protein EV154DRAFT_477451 [Mucor mucedo]|uniref:uncharacterized protein n=1 Tax=Mucor mucedo TaxID=29922 RepID=UPI00221FC077|nr:uncharacterized protein EV154DRAFT_477451 [Mucor mucedo]KAI7895315.1 hypothetical protein EV154DRAFT_477451 [Mucor mucedo]